MQSPTSPLAGRTPGYAFADTYASGSASHFGAFAVVPAMWQPLFAGPQVCLSSGSSARNICSGVSVVVVPSRPPSLTCGSNAALSSLHPAIDETARPSPKTTETASKLRAGAVGQVGRPHLVPPSRSELRIVVQWCAHLAR